MLPLGHVAREERGAPARSRSAHLLSIPVLSPESLRAILARRPIQLRAPDPGDVSGLGLPLLALRHVELHLLVLPQETEPRSRDRGLVDEDVAVDLRRLDEAEALGHVEPLHAARGHRPARHAQAGAGGGRHAPHHRGTEHLLWLTWWWK